MDEFEIIRHFFSNRTKSHRPEIVTGIGDDCAILNVPAGEQLVLSMDTLVNGVHFPTTTSAHDIGHKALAVNLSDLAAMGATPAWATLSLTLPSNDHTWLKEFSEGFFNLGNKYGVELIGGDTTKGPLAITVQAHGFVPKGQAITRSGAKPGDLVYVTHTLGDAGLALEHLNRKVHITSHAETHAFNQLNRPEPRINEGLLLRGFASAMIDVSDGFAADLSHILRQSQVGAIINLENIPLSKELTEALSKEQAIRLALTSGDDYELCFTLPKVHQEIVEKMMSEQGIPITCLGTINSSLKLECLLDGQSCPLELQGYLHF